MSQLRQMNTQLVGAAGDRFQQQTGTMVHALQHFESSECLFAPLVADFLSRSIGPVRRDWQIDFSPVLPDSTEHDGVVVLLYGALLELPADVSMGWFVQGNDHDARGVEIQPMHDTGRGVILLQARDKAVFVFWMAPWNGQQQVRLAHQQQVPVGVENIDCLGAMRYKVRL